VLLALFCLFSAAAIALGVASLHSGQRQWNAIRSQVQAGPPLWTPPATLIVPIKGLEPGLVDNLRSLLEQDYPDYELLIAVRDSADPAVAQIKPWLNSRARLVVAGRGPRDTSEKIGNLLAAVSQARANSEVFAFADSDGRAGRGWLRGLISPLRDPAVGAATGYRWYFPDRGEFWPLVQSVWNAAIAGTFGAGDPPFAWGGAMAIRRNIFEKARVAEYWLGSVSDDYQLTRAIRAAGLRIAYSAHAMVETGGGCSACEFLEWAVRQLTIARIYDARTWWLGLAAHAVYCAAMATGIAMLAEGRFWAAPVFFLTFVPGMCRGAWRERVARLLFPARKPWFDHHGWVYCWLTPAVTWIWLWVFLASLFRRRIEWRGNVYELLGPSQTKVEE